MDIENRCLFRWLFFINFAVTLGFGVADAFFSVFVQGLGARGILLGSAIGFYAASKIIFSPFMGALSDRLGRKVIIVASLLLFTLVSLCYLSSTNLQVIILLRLMQGIGCAMFRPVIVSMVGENAPSRSRGTVVATFDMSFYGALSLGPLLGGILMDYWGFSGIFLLLTSLCTAALIVALSCIPATPTPATATRSPGLFAGATRLTQKPSALPGLLAFIFGRGWGIITIVSFLPLLLTSKLGLSGAQIGLIMAATTLVTTLFLRPMGKLSDRIPRPALIIMGGSMVSLLYLLIPLAQTFNQMFGLGIGIGFFSGVSQPACTALLVEEGVKFGTGFAVGTFNATLNLGLAVGPLIGALLESTAGLTAVFYSAGLLGFVAVAVFAMSMELSRPALHREVRLRETTRRQVRPGSPG